jgi:putative aldouronate transport system permease protein
MAVGSPHIARHQLRLNVRELWKFRQLYLLLLPVLVYFALFKYWPIWWLSISFKDYRLYAGFAASPWVGLKHYLAFFNSRDFFMIISNTLLINLYALVFAFPVPIIFALLLNELSSIRFKRTVQTISYLPHFVSTVVAVGLIASFLSPTTGPLNQTLRALGFEPVFFMAKAKYFRTIYIVSEIWQHMGWQAIVYLAALAAVDLELYEAAVVDGASRWKQLLHVTLPSIASTIIVMLVLRIGYIMTVGFEKMFLMSNPMVRQVSEVISTYVYRRGLLNGDYSFATAVGFFNSLVALLFIAAANGISRKFSDVSVW